MQGDGSSERRQTVGLRHRPAKMKRGGPAKKKPEEARRLGEEARRAGEEAAASRGRSGEAIYGWENP
jgi:hypothetical protein